MASLNNTRGTRFFSFSAKLAPRQRKFFNIHGTHRFNNLEFMQAMFVGVFKMSDMLAWQKLDEEL